MQRKPSYRPRLEWLEDRLAPATVAIIDNGDAGFSATGGFSSFPGQGYQDDVSFAAAGTGSETATWTFSNLTPGQYRVSATWSEHANRATNAPFTVLNGGTPLATVLVNQELAPDDFGEAGVLWENLGTYNITSSSLTVRLADNANEYVIADAVRLERIEPGVLDNGQAGYAESGPGWVPWTGQGYGGGLSFAAPGTGANTTTWQFNGLAAGTYTIQATWTAHANRASNAPFQVFDGPTLRQTVVVNQQLAPSGTLAGDTVFQSLATVQISSGMLRLVLSDNANGYVIADAARLVGPPVNITNLPDYEVAPDLVSDATGNLHLVYQGGPSGGWHVKYAYKPADGNWQPAVDLGGVNIQKPRIALDPSGGLHVVWFDQNEVFYRKRPTPASAWTPVIQLSSSPGVRSLEADVAADGLGRIHVVWHDEPAGNWNIHYRRFENNAWQPEEVISTRGDDDVFPRVAAGADGQVHVVWHNSGSNEVYYRNRTTAGVWAPIVRLDTSPGRSYNPDIVVDASNNVHVSWHDDLAGDWNIAYVRRQGGVWSAPQYFNNAGVTDAFSHLAIAPDGSVTLCWMDYNNLYVVRRQNNSWTPIRRVITDRGAKDNAIAVDPATGRVHIVAQVQRAGITQQGSWDLFWYTE